MLKDLDRRLGGRDVIIVEDIVDTGLTLRYLQESCAPAARGRCAPRACSASRRGARSTCKVEYIGFTIEDQFVVGYGLDYAEQYRNLPYIAVIWPS